MKPDISQFGLELSLNYIDYELYPPTALDQHHNVYDPADSDFATVPIIRIFGRTDAGQNICTLVHGVYPYMYIEYNGDLDSQTVNSNCLRLHQGINVALATAYRRNPHDDGSTFVADITICKATPFYGLHSGWKPYYKISLLSPKHMTRLADLFRSGAILVQSYQPYESHVPYLLQFMIDYNLYGCGTVRFRSVNFRQPLPSDKETLVTDTGSDDPSYDSVHSLNGHKHLGRADIPKSYILSDDYCRYSHSEIEIDVSAGSIINRDALQQRAIHYDIASEGQKLPLNNDRLLPSLTELWREDSRRREALGLTPSKSQLPHSDIRQRSNVWSNEQELKKSLASVLKAQVCNEGREQSTEGQAFSQPSQRKDILDAAAAIPTSFESIQSFCNRQALVINKQHRLNDLTTPLDTAAILSQIDKDAVLQMETLERQRIAFMATQNSLQDSSATTVLSRVTRDPIKSIRFQNATPHQLSMDIKLSGITRTSTVLSRLRGGAGSPAQTDSDYSSDGEFTLSDSAHTLVYAHAAPTSGQMEVGSSSVISSDFPEPFYGDHQDVPLLAREYAVNGVMPRSSNAIHLPNFFTETQEVEKSNFANHARIHEYAVAPPTKASLSAAWQMADTSQPVKGKSTQINLPTQHNASDHTHHSAKFNKVSEADVPLSVFSIEVHAQSLASLLPNPTSDPIVCIFWAFQDFGLSEAIRQGCIISTQEIPNSDGLKKTSTHGVLLVDTEVELIHTLIELVRTLDPDALLSFEMQNSSIGYIEERTKSTFGFSAEAELGRLLPTEKDDPGYNDRWGETHATSVKVSGRHVLNLWRIMRSEMNLLQYTLENVCYHQLRLRIPKYSHVDLHRWLLSGQAGQQQRVLKYYTQRTRLNLEIIESQGLLARVSEQARLLGIDFYSVFSRGSQFKVESLMFRIAKPECFMMLSPSKKQVAQQNALECLPLVMEPQSKFYHDPVVVLDFQSLYPSIMIAYNFCYSTCLGKLGYKGLVDKLGVTHYTPDPATMLNVADDIEIAPNGLLYVRDHRRKSLLAKMLHDLLETRAMVKEGMKLCRNDKAAQKLMHNRQLALKLIANVTYGYTSASFSGRMPCADIADSIVQTGRETLEKAMEFIHSHEGWNAEVVYGDTDSLFVKLAGRTKAEAFKIGGEMAREITKMSPTPVKLKFEKVYLPCVLLAKKRYVGFKYESPQDIEPVFDAKGIETVRRDGTPAEQKIEEMALKILFRTGDLSAVKDFFQQECWKIMTGRCSLHDFCFAKEVKLGSYSTKGVPPPGAVISAKSIAADPRSEPQYGERVSYLVISGPSRSRLTDRCVAPEELLLNPNLRLDVEYYITKNIIPPLDRIFSLMGVNVRSWYDEMPRSLKLGPRSSRANGQGKQSVGKMIDAFLSSSHCLVCRCDLAKSGVCKDCRARPERAIYDVQQEVRALEETHNKVLRICASCCHVPMYSEIACVSKDCPVYYKRIKSGREVDIHLVQDIEDLLPPQTAT